MGSFSKKICQHVDLVGLYLCGAPHRLTPGWSWLRLQIVRASHDKGTLTAHWRQHRRALPQRGFAFALFVQALQTAPLRPGPTAAVAACVRLRFRESGRGWRGLSGNRPRRVRPHPRTRGARAGRSPPGRSQARHAFFRIPRNRRGTKCRRETVVGQFGDNSGFLAALELTTLCHSERMRGVPCCSSRLLRQIDPLPVRRGAQAGPAPGGRRPTGLRRSYRTRPIAFISAARLVAGR